MDFVTSLPILVNWKDDSYNSIFVILDFITKMMYYKPVITIINKTKLAKVILDIVIRYLNLSNSIMSH